MKKIKVLIAATLITALLAGCGTAANNSTAATDRKPDVVTTASIVNEQPAFIKAVGEDGNWIVAILQDLAFDQEVVVAGEFHDKGLAENDIYRKIALYAQDENKNITASYTLTVPQLTVQSENLRIQGGTVKGDIHVDANGFNLHETASVDGNIYFSSEEFKASARIDGKVTGVTEVHEAGA